VLSLRETAQAIPPSNLPGARRVSICSVPAAIGCFGASVALLPFARTRTSRTVQRRKGPGRTSAPPARVVTDQGRSEEGVIKLLGDSRSGASTYRALKFKVSGLYADHSRRQIR